MYVCVQVVCGVGLLFVVCCFVYFVCGLYMLVVEVIELIEKVDNVLQVIEDVYFVCVYSVVFGLFCVFVFSVLVDCKLVIICDIYVVLYEEVLSW